MGRRRDRGGTALRGSFARAASMCGRERSRSATERRGHGVTRRPEECGGGNAHTPRSCQAGPGSDLSLRLSHLPSKRIALPLCYSESLRTSACAVPLALTSCSPSSTRPGSRFLPGERLPSLNLLCASRRESVSELARSGTREGERNGPPSCAAPSRPCAAASCASCRRACGASRRAFRPRRGRPRAF